MENGYSKLRENKRTLTKCGVLSREFVERLLVERSLSIIVRHGFDLCLLVNMSVSHHWGVAKPNPLKCAEESVSALSLRKRVKILCKRSPLRQLFFEKLSNSIKTYLDVIYIQR